MPIFSKLSHFYLKIKYRGIDVFNDYFPQLEPYNDLFSERVKSALLLVGSLSILMMVTSPVGFLYACYPRPFYVGIFLLHFIKLPSGFPPTPEWGIHYITLLMYTYFAYSAICNFEERGINKPFHKIAYVFLLTIFSFYVPFELTYITLYDIFHSIPMFGYPAIWFFGWWKGISMLWESVIATDLLLSISCLIGIRIILKDLRNYYDLKINWDKKSKVLLLLFFVSMFLWVIIPTYLDVHSFGSKWFPQTIYVDYGYFEDYNIPIPKNGDIYGVVKEYWYPNDIIKIHNHISKLISVMFMFYLFTPTKRVNNGTTKKT